ncbi:DUF1656 domain-containing protein [Thalassoglobus sp. JC818]|uniref:DUF1656 domain-containing protein n=1 Tax=Thalassoglobus sp. JC818 TaxID=3232136 RepID=UPI003458B2F4
MLGQRTPTEVAFNSIYFPPFFFTVMVGFLCAIGIHKLLKLTGGDRWFWNPGLLFIAIWLLMTSLIGLTVIPP